MVVSKKDYCKKFSALSPHGYNLGVQPKDVITFSEYTPFLPHFFCPPIKSSRMKYRYKHKQI
jgi:hypothetical protein